MNKLNRLKLFIVLTQLVLTIGCSECHNSDDIDFKRLYTQQDDPNSTLLDTNKFSLLQYFNEAKKSGKNIDINKVKDLVEQKGADLTAKGRSGRNVLHEALHAKSEFEVIKYLVEQLETKHPNKVKHMLNEKDKEQKAPFIYATSCFDNINILKYLVAHGAKPTERDLQIALEVVVATNNLNNLEMFKYLLLLNNKITANIDISLLNKIVKSGNDSFFKSLVKNQIKQEKSFQDNNKGQTANTLLHDAISSGNEKIVRVLIKKMNPDVNSRNVQGKTPLILAIEMIAAPIVRTLIREGADPTLPDADGKLPLEIAQQKLKEQQDNNQGVTHNTAQQVIVKTLTSRLKINDVPSQ